MKQLVYLIALAVLVCVLWGCGQHDDEAKIYQLEKLRVNAARLEEKVIGIKPELATKEGLITVLQAHEKVLDFYKQNFAQLAQKDALDETEEYISRLAGESLLRTGQLNLRTGDTSAAKAAFSDFENIFRHQKGQQKFAWFSLAQLYDNDNNADKVEELYLKLIGLIDPPADSSMIPDNDILPLAFQLSAFYEQTGNKDKAEYYLRFAEDYYSRLRNSYPGTPLWGAATRYLAETYKSAGQPKEAVSLLETVVDSTGQTTRGALMLIAQTYFELLDNSDKAVEYYQKVLSRGEDSLFTPQALMEMGNVYLIQKRYEKARQAFKQIIDRDNAVNYHPQAYRLTAISYEESKDYSQAQDNYIAVVERFSTSPMAFDVYLYLPEFFEKQDKKQLRDQWYNRAETFYRQTRDNYPERTVGAAAQEYLARLYTKYEDWNKAVEELKYITENYANYRFAADAYFRIAVIYEDKIKDIDSARVYYQKQVDNYPGFSISESAKQKIQTL